MDGQTDEIAIEFASSDTLDARQQLLELQQYCLSTEHAAVT